MQQGRCLTVIPDNDLTKCRDKYMADIEKLVELNHPAKADAKKYNK